MGGIATNQWGETSQRGLFAVGEASGGAHGANRLGGNSLAEIFSMGSLVGLKAAELARNIKYHSPAQEDIDIEISRLETLFARQGRSPKELIQDLKALMWDKAGIIRDKQELEKALNRIQGPWPEAAVDNPRDLQRLLEFQNMRLIAELVCTAALQRTESRGSHYRIDYPEENNTNWIKNIFLSKRESGMKVEIKTLN
jgi:succinate dehydrogenase/fumarate reductase flavoprotein subunit